MKMKQKNSSVNDTNSVINEDLCFYLSPMDVKVKEELPRVRKEMNKIEKMAESLEKYGQLQPVLISREYELIAGGRRLAACMLSNRKVKCIFKDTVDPLLMREMELEENLQREDLTPSEEVLAVEEIHRLKQSIHGVAISGSEGSGWTMEQTAELIGKSKGSVAGDLALAETLKMFPELSSCKTKSDIKKAAKGIEKMSQRIDAISKHEEILSKVKNPVILACADAREYMKTISDNSIDIVLTDPPWGIDINKLAITLGGQTGGDHTSSGFKYTDDKEYAMEMYKCLAKESFRFTKSNAHLYTFVAFDSYWIIQAIFENQGWIVRPKAIIWIKSESGSNNAPQHWPSSAYECILYARKIDSKLVVEGKVDWIQVNRVSSSEKLHEAEKPVELIRELLIRTSLPSQVLFDPFMGSGATIEAALDMMMYPVGCDIMQESYASTLHRIANWERRQNGK
jgi:site-specific DNA-methyltransferase (adenine-specific)